MSWNIAKPGDQINGSLVVTGTVTINSALTLGGNFTMTSGVGVITSTSDADTTNPLKLVNAGASGGTEVSFSLQPGSNAARLAQLAAVNDGSGNVTLHLRTSAAGAAANRLTILPAGNVGIGTASPANKLDVNGILSASSGIFGGTGASNITVGASGIYNGFVSNSSVYLVSDGGSASGLFAYGSTHATKPSVLELRSGSAVRATLDTTGNLGLGVTPSAWDTSVFRTLQIGSGSGSVSLSGRTDNNPNAVLASNAYYSSSGYRYVGSSAASYYNQQFGVHSWFTAPSGTAGNAISFNQAMTLDASGNLLVGKITNALVNVGVSMQANGLVASTLAGSTNGTDTLNVYSNGVNGYRFYVGMGGTVYAVNTTISAISDARLKENVQDIDVGLDAILALKPRKFDWKEGKGKNIKGDRGFIAQEFETVFPNLIDTWKDAAPEGEVAYKSVRQDLIPVLVKAIQELTARVQTLENA